MFVEQIVVRAQAKLVQSLGGIILVMFRSVVRPCKIVQRSSRFNSVLVDRELQNSYGIFPRLMAIPKLFIDPTEKDSFSKLVKNKIVFADKLITGLKVFSDLKNPLLEKYEFDPVDFVKGATEAFSQLHKAMASREFSNYVTGFSKVSETNDLMKSSFSPRIYKACIEATQHIDSIGLSINMTHLDIKRVLLSSVNTHIIDEMSVEKSTIQMLIDTQKLLYDLKDKDVVADLNELDSTTEFEIPIHSDGRTVKINIAQEPSSLPVEEQLNIDAEYIFIDENAVEYPAGCVVASVDVVFETHEVYMNKMNSETEAAERESTREGNNNWTFDACISGE